MATNKTVKLSSGYDCPLLGYGTFLSNDVAQLKAGVKAAVEAGYRHIDTAQAYMNEHVIGETLQDLYDAKVCKREDLFLTTKLFPTHFRPELVEPTLKKQLEKLKTPYLDLYLMHMPFYLKPPATGDFHKSPAEMQLDVESKFEDTWRELEKCVKAGLVRSIGISNFNVELVERILKCATIKPAVNQVEMHPLFQNKKLAEFCRSNNIVMTAYSQFGRPGVLSPVTGKPFYEGNILEDERLVKIAEKYGKKASHVILRWLIQQNTVTIPKSVTPARIVDNFNVWDFQLSDADMKTVGDMDLNKRCEWLTFVPGVDKHPDYPFAADGMSC